MKKLIYSLIVIVSIFGFSYTSAYQVLRIENFEDFSIADNFHDSLDISNGWYGGSSDTTDISIVGASQSNQSLRAVSIIPNTTSYSRYWANHLSNILNFATTSNYWEDLENFTLLYYVRYVPDDSGVQPEDRTKIEFSTTPSPHYASESLLSTMNCHIMMSGTDGIQLVSADGFYTLVDEEQFVSDPDQWYLVMINMDFIRGECRARVPYFHQEYSSYRAMADDYIEELDTFNISIGQCNYNQQTCSNNGADVGKFYFDDFWVSTDSDIYADPFGSVVGSYVDGTAPVADSTTSTNTFDVDINYYVDSSLEPDIDTLELDLCPLSYDYDDCIQLTYPIDTFDVASTHTFSVTTTYDGRYLANVNMSNGEEKSTACPWYLNLLSDYVIPNYLRDCSTTDRILSSANDYWQFNVEYESGTNGIPAVHTYSEFLETKDTSTIFEGYCKIETFDLGMCIASLTRPLFAPDSSVLRDEVGKLKDTILTSFPIGYFTRFFYLASHPSDIEPPIPSYEFGTSAPSELQSITDGDPIYFDVFSPENLAFINEIESDQPSQSTIWDIFNPIFQVIVNLALLWAILSDLLRIDFASNSRSFSESAYPRSRRISFRSREVSPDSKVAEDIKSKFPQLRNYE